MKPLLVAAAVAAGSAVLSATAAAHGPWDPLAGRGPQQVTIHILSSTGAREAVLDPSIAVIPGVPVRLRVVNASREMHSFTIPALHVNALVAAGRPLHPVTTTIRFTVPSVGTYRWHCDFCPAVHHEGAMGGLLYALVTG